MIKETRIYRGSQWGCVLDRLGTGAECGSVVVKAHLFLFSPFRLCARVLDVSRETKAAEAFVLEYAAGRTHADYVRAAAGGKYWHVNVSECMNERDVCNWRDESRLCRSILVVIEMQFWWVRGMGWGLRRHTSSGQSDRVR